MIKRAMNHGNIVYQTVDADAGEMPNAALIVHVDNGGTLCIDQENDAIVLDWGTVPELCKLLLQMKKEHEK
jgi:hypothetical protein